MSRSQSDIEKLTAFRVGDAVVVKDLMGEQIGTTEVAKLMPTRIRTKDGRRWAFDGRWMDHKGSVFQFPWIEKAGKRS